MLVLVLSGYVVYFILPCHTTIVSIPVYHSLEFQIVHVYIEKMYLNVRITP